MLEPNNVSEAPIHDSTPVAAGGDISNGLRGLADHRKELLAERDPAEHAKQNSWLARRFEFFFCARPPGGLRQIPVFDRRAIGPDAGPSRKHNSP